MSTFKIIGFRFFQGRKNPTISWCSLYVVYPQSNVTGLCCRDVIVDSSKITGGRVEIDKICKISLDFNGHVIEVEIQD